VRLLAGLGPKVTEKTPENPVPAIVTDVPPVAGPLFGCASVMVGTGWADARATEAATP
jgi:hypothetical protein